MDIIFAPRAWYEYTDWQLEDKKTLKRINQLIKDIERNGNTGIGKSEPFDALYAHKPWVLKHDGTVYHWYCAVSRNADGREFRGIALATSK